MKISFRILPLLLALLFAALVRAEDIVVGSQQDFNRLPGLVVAMAEGGAEEINVIIREGTYLYRDGHMRLRDIRRPRLALAIRGQGRCVLVGRGRQLQAGQEYGAGFRHDATWLRGGLAEELPLWSTTMQAADTVRALDPVSGECLIPFRGLPVQGPDECADTYVRLTMWYRSAVYPVVRVSEEGVHFLCNDLKYDSYFRALNVNADYGFSANVASVAPVFPRFRLCGGAGTDAGVVAGRVEAPAGEAVYECRAPGFLQLDGCELARVEVEGLEFRGNMQGWHRAVVAVGGSRFGRGMTVRGNTFRYLKTEALRVDSSDNVRFEDNLAADCAAGIVRSDNASRRTAVTGNTFDRCGTGLQNTFCVCCTGTDFVVRGNTFRDFGYGAVRTGVWWAEEMKAPCRGTVEDNDISFSAACLARPQENGLMDSGAIYVATQNDSVAVSRNRIHGYGGMLQNRGIFLDDGTSGCHLTGNTVSGILNSYCIDLRRVDYSDRPQNRAPAFNRGNTMSGNRCDGPVRFETF